MNDTQVIVALAVGLSAFILFCCVAVIVVVRLRRLMKSQLETLNNLLCTLQTGRGQTPHEPATGGRDTPQEPRGE